MLLLAFIFDSTPFWPGGLSMFCCETGGGGAGCALHTSTKTRKAAPMHTTKPKVKPTLKPTHIESQLDEDDPGGSELNC